MKAAIAKMFARIDGVKNPKIAEAYKADVEEMLTGIRNHIINPFLRDSEVDSSGIRGSQSADADLR